MGELLRRCLISIKNQSFHDFEVIIIDDCSTDNSIELIKDFQKEKSIDVKLLQNKVNRGPAYSRNKGILASNSDYICFCDGDDWLDCDFFDVMHRMIRDRLLDIVFCGYRIVYASGKKREVHFDNKSDVYDPKLAMVLNNDSLCTMMIKSELMRENLLPDVRNGEDMAVIPLLISKATQIGYCDKCLYNYYRNKNSASHALSKAVLESLESSFNYLVRNIPNGFHNEIEYVCISNYLYSWNITMFSISFDIKWANEFNDKFMSIFPKWENNKYLKRLTFYKRLTTKMVSIKAYFSLLILSRLRKEMIKKIHTLLEI